MCVVAVVSGGVFTSGECGMAGLIISTIKAKYIHLHPGQVLMKDSRQAGLFHLMFVVGSYLHLCRAAQLHPPNPHPHPQIHSYLREKLNIALRG